MNSQLMPQAHRVRTNQPPADAKGIGAPAPAGVGSAGGAAFGVAVITTGILIVGSSALTGVGIGAGVTYLADGDIKKGVKWGAGIGAGIGLLAFLPFAALGTAAASQ